MRRFLLLPLIVLLLSLSAYAQSRNTVQPGERTMILTGAVYDINGSVIVSADVVAYNSDGGKYESETNDEGFYKFELPLATYKIEVGAPGFCRARLGRFKVVNSTHGKMSLDFVLEVRGDGCSSKHEMQIEQTRSQKQKSNSKPIAE